MILNIFRSFVYFISEGAFNCCVGNEYPGNIYLFKVTSNNRKECKMCSKLAIRNVTDVVLVF